MTKRENLLNNSRVDNNLIKVNEFFDSLHPSNNTNVVMESSGLWYNIYECLNKRHTDVRLSIPTKTGAIASAKIGTDKLDAVKLWIKKATGLGITEFMLRYMALPCLRNKNLEGTQICIVTDPRIDLAITLIDRMKRLFTYNGPVTFDTKETVIELKGYTSKHFFHIIWIQ